MPAHTSGDYVYFKDNEDVPKINLKFCILNQESDFYITSRLKLLAGNIYHCQNCLLKKS